MWDIKKALSIPINLERSIIKISKATTILIDKTDPFNETQILDIKRKILLEKENLEKHTRLTVFVINDQQIKVKPVFSICNPGDASDITNFDQKLLQ